MTINYLIGITISHDLRWEKHCYRIKYIEAQSLIGLARHTQYLPINNCQSKIVRQPNHALSDMSQEYGAYIKIDGVNRFEKIQRTTDRFFFWDYTVEQKYGSDTLKPIYQLGLGSTSRQRFPFPDLYILQK